MGQDNGVCVPCNRALQVPSTVFLGLRFHAVHWFLVRPDFPMYTLLGVAATMGRFILQEQNYHMMCFSRYPTPHQELACRFVNQVHPWHHN